MNLSDVIDTCAELPRLDQRSDLCKTCAHTKVCMKDKNLFGDVFVAGNPMFFDNSKLYEAYEKRKAEGFPCKDYMAEPRWIPVKMRPMDSEEREYWEDQFGYELKDEDAVMFDCQMPDDGQEILVSYRKWISMDKCEIDGGCYELEGNGDWEGVIAWMPLPEPYKEADS